MQVHLSPLQLLIVIFRIAFVRYSVCVCAHSLYAALTLVPEASPVLSLTQHTHGDSRHLVTIQQINKDTSIMLEATCMGVCVCVCAWIKNLNCHVISLEERTKSSRPSHVSPRPSRSLLCIQTLTQNSCLLSQLSLQALSLSSSWIINNLSICLYTPTPPHPPITCSAALFNNKIQFILEHCICLASCLSLM